MLRSDHKRILPGPYTGRTHGGILFRHVPILCLKEHKMGTCLKCSHFMFPFYVWRNIMYVCREHKMGTCLKCLQIVFPFYIWRNIMYVCREHKMGTRQKCSHFLFPFYVWRNIMYVCREHKMGTCLKCLQIVFPFYYLDTIDPPLLSCHWLRYNWPHL